MANPLRKMYSTARWRRIRALVFARDKGLCVACERRGTYTPGVEVDHVAKATESPQLFWDLENLQLLCKRCHGKKTASGE